MSKSNKAFTLAEVLLALAIIGVLVTVTILVVLQDTAGRETLLKVQKSYTIFSNAFENSVTKYGDIIDWDSVDTQTFAHHVGNSILAAANCGTANDLSTVNDCVPGCPKIYKISGEMLDVCKSSDVSKLMTPDGQSYAFQIEDPSCSTDVTNNAANAPKGLKMVCGTVMVDIFASKAGNNKNMYGKDLFLFYITKDGILPAGLSDDKKFPYDASKCKKRVTENTAGCTAQYIYNKNKIDE